MRISLLVFIICLANLTFGQTANHKKVAGTKCSLIPPEGFTVATNFSGFQNNALGASIMVIELPAPLQSVTGSFTAEDLKAKGMILIDKQEIDFNNSKAVYAKVSQPANGTVYLKQMLIFGDDKNTILVNGIYPQASKAIEAKMKASLLSTSWNALQNDNPLDAVKFSIDVTGTEFKFTKSITGSLLYTYDGTIPTEKPTLIVGNSVGKVAIGNQKNYSIDRLKKLPRGELNVIKEISPITIDGLPGYEITAEGKTKESKDELVYQVMLFTGDEYFIIVGTAAEDLKNNLEKFKKVARTFKQK